MTAKGRKGRRAREPWRETLTDELTDETEDERRDVANADRGLFESEHGPVMGNDGDDNPEYAQPKPRIAYRAGLDPKKPVQPGDLVEQVQVKPTHNQPGQMVEAGHGFIVNDPRSRPWKTAKRTHCAHCGGPLPGPDVSNYRCEFDPEASDAELALIGAEQCPEDWPPRSTATPHLHRGCQCSGCSLRWLVLNGQERNRGQPRKYCSDNCRRWADNERNAWKRAVRAAEKRGEEPPPEPEDRGMKFRAASGLRSSIEGRGRRYTAASGHRFELPRA